MKKSPLMLFLCILLLFALSVAQAQTVELYAASVGKADALLLRCEDKTVLIDTGYAYSRGKILYGMRQLGVNALDAVIITHTDNDHVGGLSWLAESDIPVGAWYTSAYFTGKEEKHPCVLAAETRGETVQYLKAGDSLSLGSATISVLAPLKESEIENDNSLVLRVDSEAGSLLLCGDIELTGETPLRASGANLGCDVLKVPNHADVDACSEFLIAAAAPKLAVICTSTEEKPETPNRYTVETLKAGGAQVVVTDECTGGILVTLTDGQVSAQDFDVPAPAMQVRVEALDPENDLITLRNESSESTDLSGSCLYSSKGKELFVFPEGYTLDAGATLTVGTRSTLDGTPIDLLWDDKNVIHDEKRDVLTLYDANGNEISRLSNGLD